MTTYTREELNQLSDDDLALVYESVTKKPLPSTMKIYQVINEIISTLNKPSDPVQEKKIRKMPVNKIRSTMLENQTKEQTKESEKEIEQPILSSLENLSPKRGRPTKVTDEKIVTKEVAPRHSPSPKRTKPKKFFNIKTIERKSPSKEEQKEQEQTVEEQETKELETKEKEEQKEVEEQEQKEEEEQEQIVEKIAPKIVEEIKTLDSFVKEGKQEIPEVRETLAVKPPKKTSSESKTTNPPVKAARRGRPPNKKNKEETIDNIEESLGQSPIDNINKYSKQVKVLNPDASFQKTDVIREKEKETITPVIVTDSNIVSVILPVSEESTQTMKDYLHAVDFGKEEIKETEVKEAPSPKATPSEVEIPDEESSSKDLEADVEAITSGMSAITIEKSSEKKREPSPKIKLLDDEIEDLTKKIFKLEVNNKRRPSTPKKSIQDIILERNSTPRERDSTTKSKTEDEIFTRIESLSSSQSSQKPPSRTPSEKKTSVDVVSILKNVDKEKVSGDRGKKYYSSKEMETFLRDIGVKSTGKKEELAQRLLETVQKYGL